MPATSEKQKRFFGAVMGAKKGQKGASKKAKEVAEDMPKKEIKKFLKTEGEEDSESVFRKMKKGGGKYEFDAPEVKERRRFAPPTKPHVPKKGAPYNRAHEKRGMFGEDNDILKFVEAIIVKNYASANKYLNSAVEAKLRQKIEKEIDTPLFQ